MAVMAAVGGVLLLAVSSVLLGTSLFGFSTLSAFYPGDEVPSDAGRRYSVASDEDFDYLVFAQLWPESECAIMNAKEPGSCRLPAKLHGWSVHGLWPSRFHGPEGPEYCHSRPDWHFNASAVAPIEATLESVWPNVLAASSTSSLWKHEWEKHGCCAGSIPSLSDEFGYFSKGLALNKQYSLRDYLFGQGVNPSEEPQHTVADFASAVKAAIGEKKISIHCQNNGHEFYVASIRLCLDKSFAPLDCPGHAELQGRVDGRPRIPTMEPCPEGKMLHYPPSVSF